MAIVTSETLDDERIRQLQELYATWWWTEDRELVDVRRMVKHSDECIALIDTDTDSLVGFARVLTDHVYKALIFDVIVATSHQDQGLGRDLVEAVIDLPALEAVEHVELYCLPELVPFYEQWGFTEELDGLRLLRRERP